MNSYSSADYNSETEGNGLQTNPEATFQKKSETIAKSIQKIHQNVSQMQRMVKQFGTAQDSPDLKSQFHQIRTYTQQLVKDTDTLLKELVSSNDRHLKIQRDRLVDEFTTALNAFQAVQKKTVDLEKTAFREARANNYRIAKPPGSNHSSSNSNRSGIFDDSFGSNRGPTQTQMQEEIDLHALEEQERSIRELEENIVGVNEIYKKLGALVHEQGITVDSIESNVENTTVRVTQGTEQLRKASHYQNKLRKKKLCICVVAAAVLFIVIMLIVWQS